MESIFFLARLAQDSEPGFEGGVGEAFSTVTLTRSKRDRRNQRLHRELAAKDLQFVDLTEQNVKLSEQVQLLSDEIKRLKKLPKHPKLKPNKGSGMHDKVKAKISNSTDGKRKKRRCCRKLFSDSIQ